VNIKSIIGWAVVIGLAWYLFTQPAAAGGALHTAFHSAQTFLSNLTG
jgi:hypothetical protein